MPTPAAFASCASATCPLPVKAACRILRLLWCHPRELGGDISPARRYSRVGMRRQAGPNHQVGLLDRAVKEPA